MTMTVKWITTHSGIERTRLFEAENVEFFQPGDCRPSMPMMVDGTGPGPKIPFKHHDYDLWRASVFIDAGPGGAGFMLTEGVVYVMNGDGRTISTFRLASEQSLSEASDLTSQQR